MAGHGAGLLLLVSTLLLAAICGLDPVDRNTTPPQTGSPPGPDEVSTSVTEIYSSNEVDSGSIVTVPQTARSSAGSTHSYTLSASDQAARAEDDTARSFTTTSSNLTTGATAGPQQDLRSLLTNANATYTKVDDSGNISFSHDSSFSISMSECSIPSYFEFYTVLGDMSFFKSPTLSAADALSCAMSVAKAESHHYIRGGQIIFSSNDTHNGAGPVDSSTSVLCFYLRTPPYTNLLVHVESLHAWMTSAEGLLIEMLYPADTTWQHALYHVWLDHFEITNRRQLRSASNVMRLKVYGLQEVFQHPDRSLTLSLTAVPSCMISGLDLNYPMHNTTGYIQSVSRGDESRNDFPTYSCVTVPVPANHSVMVSFSKTDFEKCCECQFVEIYFTNACNGTPEATLCHNTGFDPTVFDTNTVSIGYQNIAMDHGTGFRLLFTFHHTSQRPVQLETGQWDCAAPGASLWMQHFLCSPWTFCDGGEDRDMDGCPSAEFCGANFISLGGRCYLHFSPLGNISWHEAEDTCKVQHGHLVSLNTQQEWTAMIDWMEDTQLYKNKYVLIGMKLNTFPEHDTYSTLLQWSDSTIALFYRLDHWQGLLPSYCTAYKERLHRSGMAENQLMVIDCHARLRADFLCEINFKPDLHSQPAHRPHISLPVPVKTASDISGMIECNDHHTTWQLIGCDFRSGAKSSAGSTACPQLSLDLGSAPSLQFPCRDNSGCVPYTLMCDHRQDCDDGSDEDFCVYQPCTSIQSACRYEKQCIPLRAYCDGVRQCVDGSDEMDCMATPLFSSDARHQPPPAIIHFTTTGSLAVAPWNTSCPDTHFLCPGEGYCLPVYVRCNSVYDCPGREDEKGCDRYTCPGFYHCRNSPVCVHADHVCDGVFQCPEHDDELTCGMTCPDTCQCLGHAFVCSSKFMSQNFPELRYLNADGTGMKLKDVSSNRLLIYLSLKRCNITHVEFLDLPNLNSLDLSHNSLITVTGSELAQFNNLRLLSVASNNLLSLNFSYHANRSFPEMIFVDLSDLNIQEIFENFFWPFPNIQHLNLSGNRIEKVFAKGFSGLHQLKVLDLTDSPIMDFSRDIFVDLKNIESITADNYKLCCPDILPDEFHSDNCHAPADEISSCDALLRADVFRVFLAVYAILALVGNLASFVYRVCSKQGDKKQLGFDVFVTHLCVSDFLMGVYLAIIGVADQWYYGSYEWNDNKWKNSAACHLAGFLSLLSSEVSAFLICVITLERFLVIRFPFDNMRFSVKFAQVLSVAGWMVGVVLAAVPLLPFTEHWRYYSQTGICIPLPITRKRFPGSDYSFYVMIVFNFVLFLLIAVGQLLVFWSYHSHSKKVSRPGKKADEMAIARRLLIVVMSDFLCWFPIGLLGLMARSSIRIPGEVNVAMAIFVLPFNSAANPFLYTLQLARERRRQARKVGRANDTSNKEMVSTACQTCSVNTDFDRFDENTPITLHAFDSKRTERLKPHADEETILQEKPSNS